MGMREKLIELLSMYFNIGDSYSYNLTRMKTAFASGTMGFDDFEEFDDDTIADIVDYLIAKGVTIPVRCKDCKYAENMMPIGNSNGCLMGDCILRKEDDIIVTAWEDEFCSYGERRTDEALQ